MIRAQGHNYKDIILKNTRLFIKEVRIVILKKSRQDSINLLTNGIWGDNEMRNGDDKT